MIILIRIIKQQQRRKKQKMLLLQQRKKNKKKEKKKADKQQAIANGNNTDSHGKEKGKKVTSTGASNMAARVAGGRRVMKKANTKKHKDGGIASKVQRTENKKDVKKKLKDKLHKKTGGLNPKHANKQQLVPGVMQQSTKGKQDSIGTKEGGDGDGGQETYSMGYSYTTTVTDARVQAISGKHKALLAKAIPGTTKK